LSSFSPAKRYAGGVNSRCKKCNAKAVSDRYHAKKAEAKSIEERRATYPRIPDDMKQCKYCLAIKTKEGNFRKVKCADGFGVKCNSCYAKTRPSRKGCAKAKALWKTYYKENREELLSKQCNSEAKKAYAAARYELHKDRILEKNKEYRRHPRSRAMHAARQSARVRRLTCAQPDWLSRSQLEEIRSLYWLAQDLKSVSGQVYHVDHIVPLQGENICGLHVPWNLQILPEDMNLRKSNNLEI
jgi:hypothetical protein